MKLYFLFQLIFNVLPHPYLALPSSSLASGRVTSVCCLAPHVAYYGLKPRPYIYVILQFLKELLCMTIEKAVGRELVEAVGQELYFWRTKKGLSQEKLGFEANLLD
jgi:hypothetical protein